MVRAQAIKKNNMKTAIISIHGLQGIDKPKRVKTVQFEDEKQLIAHLKELQKGYHEAGDGRPTIERHESTVDGKKRRVIECFSHHTDFRHVALIGFKFKPEAGLPFEILGSSVKQDTPAGTDPTGYDFTY